MASSLQNLLPGLKYPIIMAPMFLVTNTRMVIEATKSGIAGCIPALNFKNTKELEKAIVEMKSKCEGPFGINLIVNKSNLYYKEQLRVCCKYKVDFIITSLGSPAEVIRKAHEVGIKVFCDVTDVGYAVKVEAVGADALIAVNNRAGGHAGQLTQKELLKTLKENCRIPIISAGGISTAKGVKFTLDIGADGLSMGSVFIASEEADVSQEYKEACVQYGADDIVMTTKLSGTPCTVINTPYVQTVGTNQNGLERFLNQNKSLKKWLKAFVFYKGMKSLQNAAFSTTYKTVWCAGPSIEHVKSIRPIKEIVKELVSEIESIQS
ncbi:MAG: nitronate monooxygenase [Flavobacteriales bacterium]|nr:nitronate monooxygenase [Flavobacteriales bacterium]